MVYRRESLVKQIEKLKEYYRDIESYKDLPFEEYLADKRCKYAIERLLFLIAENILDFLDHLLSTRFSIVSEGYENILENSYKRGIIDKGVYQKLKGLGGFRNVLAYEYIGLDDKEVYRNFTKMKTILPEIIAYLENLVE